MVLVDSTVWIDLLRKRRSAPVVMLERLLDLGEAAVAPVIVQEILQGAMDSRAFKRLSDRFSALPTLGMENLVGLHVAAARLYASARWQGVTPRSAHDCLIAVIAVANGVALLHDDRDFEQLAGIEPELMLLPRN